MEHECVTHDTDVNCIQNFDDKTYREAKIERSGCRRENDILIDLNETRWDVVEGICFKKGTN
jgi:hypothetical protein